MIGSRKSFVVLAASGALMLILVYQAGALEGPKVSEIGNRHNLSSLGWSGGALADNTSLYRATGGLASTTNLAGKQICIFCHTPHNANVENQAPLWNRKFSLQTFSRYSTATLQIRVNSTISAPGMANYGTNWAPDGSSKLCLSCHDGSSAAGRRLGDVLRGGPIEMVSGKEYIASDRLASFNPSTNKMKTGHHPVSFVYNGTVQQAISSARLNNGFQLPTAVPQVKLDKNQKMQCTTCHNPHQNQSDDGTCYETETSNVIVPCGSPVTATRKVVPFWVYGVSGNASTDHDAVCTSCHDMKPKPFYP